VDWEDSGAICNWALLLASMYISRIISLYILYLIAMFFAPIPICGCCLVAINRAVWQDEVDGLLNGHANTSSEFIGSVALAGVLLFLPATILLHRGQKKDGFRWSGFILMFAWACVSLYHANIDFEAVIHFKTELDAYYKRDTSSPAVYVYMLLALDIALAIPCACILVRKPT
jgi:hypothetical protein